LFGLFVCERAIAEMYKWVDKSGIVHIQDSPPENTSDTGKIGNRRERNTAPAVRRPPEATSAVNPEKAPEAKRDPKVDLYVTSWCPYSQQALAYFKAKGVPFTVYDVEKDPDARRRQKEVNPTGSVPTVVINGTVLRGYNPGKFDKLLNE